jgi:hypothetical protein
LLTLAHSVLPILALFNQVGGFAAARGSVSSLAALAASRSSPWADAIITSVRFTLVYEGPLPSRQRGVSPVKAQLRQTFSRQVEEPLRSRVESFEYLDSPIDGREFVCVVNDRFRRGGRA